MRATPPHIDVPGDNANPIVNTGRFLGEVGEIAVRECIMRRSGDCMGMTSTLAVWRFGFSANSEAANAYGVHTPHGFPGFRWVLATRKTGKVREIFDGFALNLPPHFHAVIDG